MTPTPAHIKILQQRFPGIGVPTLIRNAEQLLARPHLRAPLLTPSPAPQIAPKAEETPKARKPARRSQTPRTRNAGTITEAAFWGMLRSGLRRTFRFWKPIQGALRAARIPFSGPRGQKWAFLCADCKKLHLRKNVHVDHVVPCGKLTSYDHIGEFVRRLTPEDPQAFAVRCKQCHQLKTNSERQK